MRTRIKQYPVMYNVIALFFSSPSDIGAGIAQWYSAGLRAGLMIGGSSRGKGWEFFSSQPRPDRHWRSPTLLCNGHQGVLSWN
jgi:hypothetical protein